jgi:hypothetical protein
MPRFVLASLLLPSLASAQDGALRVTGGAPASPGAWPDVAGVVFSGQFVGCTGTLVAPNVVLTAQHCTAENITHVVLDSTNWFSDEDGVIVEVADVFAHPDADIAALLLAESVDIEPRVLASGCVADEYVVDGAPVAIVGYGLTSASQQFNTQLNEGFTTVVDADCSSSSLGCDTRLDRGSEIYAGGEGADACNGDSGGPLYLLTEVGSYLVGVTSRGPAGCRNGAIWVRPDAFEDWIESRTGVELPDPTCNVPPELSTATMTVPESGREKVNLEAFDAEGEDLTWEIVEAPVHGNAEIDADGTLKFHAYDDYLGPDRLVVAVTDVGVPAHTVTAEVTIEIVERGFLGCSTGGAPASVGGLAAAAALVARRRARRAARGASIG